MNTLINVESADKIDNLLLNMHGGLLPENLSYDEITLLEKRYGVNWFNVLGYKEPKYKKPTKY